MSTFYFIPPQPQEKTISEGVKVTIILVLELVSVELSEDACSVLTQTHRGAAPGSLAGLQRALSVCV